MSHVFFVLMSYATTFGLIAALIFWVFYDGRTRKKEIATLEAQGIKRRSSNDVQT